jgi:hypothetical protein
VAAISDHPPVRSMMTDRITSGRLRDPFDLETG